MAFLSTRKEYQGGAVATTLSGAINSGASSFQIAASTGWPTGSSYPFVLVIDRGTALEERILCASRSGTTITVSSRGYDGTTGVGHAAGATVEHCLDAVTISEANQVAADATRPLGVVFQTAVTSDQGSITSAADLTNLTTGSPGVAALSSARRFRITANINVQTGTATEVAQLALLKDGTQLKTASAFLTVASKNATCTLVWEGVPGDTSNHVYKLQLSRQNATGTLTMKASATDPAQLLVEDIGT